MDYHGRDIAPKPVRYAGVNFRSTLEARWASEFDARGWSWRYEPYRHNGWLIDFELDFRHKDEPYSALCEVKPFRDFASWVEHRHPGWGRYLSHHLLPYGEYLNYVNQDTHVQVRDFFPGYISGGRDKDVTRLLWLLGESPDCTWCVGPRGELEWRTIPGDTASRYWPRLRA
jgi:hypothetical protein